jgi:hypothetical protein
MVSKVLMQLRVPPELAEKVKEEAEHSCRSVNGQILFFIQEGLKQKESEPSVELAS